MFLSTEHNLEEYIASFSPQPYVVHRTVTHFIDEEIFNGNKSLIEHCLTLTKSLESTF